MARLAFAPAVGDLQRRALTVPLLFLSLSPFVRWSSTARALPLSIRDVHSNKQQKHQQRRRRRGISGGESEAPSRHPALVPCFWKGSRSDRADRNYVHRFRFASAFCGSERAAVLTRLVFPYSDDGTSVAAPMPSAWILTGCLSAAACPSLPSNSTRALLVLRAHKVLHLGQVRLGGHRLVVGYLALVGGPICGHKLFS